jgi:pimeloyl-ACP methyl ester carboxylesterase
VRIVLLPGMDGSGTLFAPFIAELGPSLVPVVVAYPRHLARYTELLPVVRAALPSDTPFVVLAESFSGPLAVMAAAERPSGLRALILVATFVRAPVARPFASPLCLVVTGPTLAAVPQWLRSRLQLSRRHDPAVAAAARGATRAVSASVLAARVRETLHADVAGELAATDAPLLYLRATRDAIVPRRCGELVREIRTDAQIVDVDGPHLVLQARPREAASAIVAFLRRCQD